MTRLLTDPTRWCSGLAAAMALTFCAAHPSWTAEASAGARPTIAVLPLANDSGEARQDFFAGGMTDEIAAALTAVRGLAVVARSSSFQLKPSDRDPKTAGAALNARFLVQGKARIVMQERARLSVRLVEASGGAELWSQDYDAAPDGIFDVEEDIARKVAAALKLPTSPDALVRSRTL